jgi:hypothetical protein
MPDSSDVEVFILAAVCEEIEKEEKKDNVDERHICIKVQPG